MPRKQKRIARKLLNDQDVIAELKRQDDKLRKLLNDQDVIAELKRQDDKLRKLLNDDGSVLREAIAAQEDELREFRIKTTKSANDIYEAREGQHDDIVLATALACWWGENCEMQAPPNPAGPKYDVEMTRLFAAMERDM